MEQEPAQRMRISNEETDSLTRVLTAEVIVDMAKPTASSGLVYFISGLDQSGTASRSGADE